MFFYCSKITAVLAISHVSDQAINMDVVIKSLKVNYNNREHILLHQCYRMLFIIQDFAHCHHDRIFLSTAKHFFSLCILSLKNTCNIFCDNICNSEE